MQSTAKHSAARHSTAQHARELINDLSRCHFFSEVFLPLACFLQGIPILFFQPPSLLCPLLQLLLQLSHALCLLRQLSTLGFTCLAVLCSLSRQLLLHLICLLSHSSQLFSQRRLCCGVISLHLLTSNVRRLLLLLQGCHISLRILQLLLKLVNLGLVVSDLAVHLLLAGVKVCLQLLVTALQLRLLGLQLLLLLPGGA